jgi:hypothetical protein
MALRLSLLIDGDAAGAKRAAEDAQKAVAAVAGSVTTASTATGVATEKVAAGVGDTAKLSAIQLQNLQFQLQDVAVGLSSGQSFSRVLLQQGSQIVQMFGAGTGIGAALRATGAGIVSFITNPLNLALLGFTLAGTAAQAFFGAVTSGAGNTSDLLEEHETLIKSIRDAWPEATEGVKAYGRESKTVLETQLRTDIAQLKSTVASEVSGILDDVSLEFNENGTTRAVTRQYLKAFEEPIQALRESAREGTPDIRAFRDAVAAVAAADPENRKLQELALQLLDLTADAAKAESAITSAEGAMRRLGDTAGIDAEAVKKYGEAMRGLAGIAPQRLSDTAKAAEELNQALASAGGVEERQAAFAAYAAALGRIRDEEHRLAAERAGRDYATEREAVERLVASLRDEYELMKLTEPERKVQEKLRQAGAAATDEERDAIRQLVEGIYQEEEAHRILQDAQEKTIAQMDEVRSTAQGIFSGILNDWKNGASAGEILLGVLDKIVDALFRAASVDLSNLLLGVTGSSSSGLLGSLISAIFGGSSSGSSSSGDVLSGIYHSGGVIGETAVATRAVPAALAAAAPRFHTGLAGLAPDERVGIFQDGETILPRGASRSVTNIYVSTPNPRAFAENRAAAYRGAARLLGRAGRYV